MVVVVLCLRESDVIDRESKDEDIDLDAQAMVSLF